MKFRERVLTAIVEDDAPTLKVLLVKRNVSECISTNEVGYTLLHMAVISRSLRCTRLLAAISPASCLVQDMWGSTPAHYCIDGEFGSICRLKQLENNLSDYTNYDIRIALREYLSMSKADAMYVRAIFGVLDTVNMRKLCTVQNRWGTTPLHIAAVLDSAAIADMILYSNIEALNIQDYRGVTALDIITS